MDRKRKEEFDPRNPYRASLDKIGKRGRNNVNDLLSTLISHPVTGSIKESDKPPAGNDEWVGVDLDGTLAYYDGWKGSDHVGEPIKEMVDRVKKWLSQGRTVKIFTARVGESDYDPKVITDWLTACGIGPLPITNVKDKYMIELWDDRAIQVEKNTGKRINVQ